MEKLKLNDLMNNNSWNEAVIVFKQESFDRDYSEKERSYRFSKNNKYFQSFVNSNSLFGNCLDGNDDGVRLDIYMARLPEDGRRWEEDYCYITK